MKNQFEPYHHFGFLTNRISRLLNQIMENRLREMGYQFPVSCVGLLADLWSHDGVTQKELGISIIKTKSSITKMLEALINEGLIVKKDHPTDRRNKLIYLTDKGKNLRSEVEDRGQMVEKMMLSEVSDTDIKNCKNILRIFYLNLSEEIFRQNESQ